MGQSQSQNLSRTELATKRESDKPSTLLEYFETHEEKPSAQIYRNMTTDPVLAEMVARKKLSYREFAIIASTVVSSLDDQIVRLERLAGPWKQLTQTVNAPLFLPAASSKHEGIVETESGTPDSEEVKWISKYLTVRNILSALLVIVSLSSGFFAWINKDYRSLLSAKDERIEQLEEDVTSTIESGSNNQIALEEARNTIAGHEQTLIELNGQLDARSQRLDDVQTKYDELRAQASAAGDAQIETQLELTRENGRLTGEVEALQARLDSANETALSWQSYHENSQNTVTDLRRQLRDRDLHIAESEGQLNSAISAWNQLLTYLYSKAGRRNVELKTRNLKGQLEILETYTKDIDGMKMKLR